MTASRIIRGRADAADARIGRSRGAAPIRNARQLVQIYNGGAMPQGQDRVYLGHPVDSGGGEAEGGPPSYSVDGTRSVPVVVIGSRQVAVGDILLAHSVAGRWVAESGAYLPNCNPACSVCTGNRYAAAGTVSDAINGTQPIVYDFAHQAWYSAWLPFTSPYTLQSGAGYDPCLQGNGKSYYFYQFTCSSASSGYLLANLFLPAQTCHDVRGNPTIAYFNYPGPDYPGLLGLPANSIIQGFTLPSLGTFGGCDPMTYAASWTAPAGGTGAMAPFAGGATFSVPKYTPPAYGFTCSIPCPLPRKNLTVSWTGPVGAGSATLAWNATTKDWTSPCVGGVTFRMFNTGSSTLGFTASTWGGAGCTPPQFSFNYPASIGLGAFVCQPLFLSFNVLYNTSTLYLAGYRTFVVTE